MTEKKNVRSPAFRFGNCLFQAALYPKTIAVGVKYALFSEFDHAAIRSFAVPIAISCGKKDRLFRIDEFKVFKLPLAVAKMNKKPGIILMDEPSMGLSPLYVNEIFDIIREVNSDGTTVLLVEQNAKKALAIANRAYVLETGKIVLSGDAKELMNDDSVKKAYLGE